MTLQTQAIDAIHPHLVRCGYESKLIVKDYHYSETRDVELAAFAHAPFDARSACVAAVTCADGDQQSSVLNNRAFGAPVVFVVTPKATEVWKPGPLSAERVAYLPLAENVDNFFAENSTRIAPESLYRAKTIGRLEGLRQRSVNRFVNTDLLPFAEEVISKDLVQIVEQAVAEALTIVTPQNAKWALKTVFRLLAAKILKDKKVPTFSATSFTDWRKLLEVVNDHYGAEQVVHSYSSREVKAVEAVLPRFDKLWNLRHLTTETLADVYEHAMVTEDIRKSSGTHRTPSYLADYMLWQLAPWISQFDPKDVSVFEPTCGHAPFLVAAMRLLRSNNLVDQISTNGQYYRDCLTGVDYDPFAIEVARLSLTIADVPNRNKWAHVRQENIFNSDVLAREISRANVILCNPPFEGTKAIQLLDGVISHSKPGTCFGLIIPTGRLMTRDPKKEAVRKLRERLLTESQVAEVLVLPDGIFAHADQEITVLIGRKRRRAATKPLNYTKLKRVREEQLNSFREDYRFTTNRVVPQAALLRRADQLPWIEELDDVLWTFLRDSDRLGDIATVGKGFDRRSLTLTPETEVERRARPCTSAIGFFKNLEQSVDMHRLPAMNYMPADRSTVQTPRSGLDGLPQVILNYGPADRGPWRLKPMIDREGHFFTSRFLAIRPLRPKISLEFLWAILAAPVAQAFIYTHALKRDVLTSLVSAIPLPRKVTRNGVESVTTAVQAYFAGCEQLIDDDLFSAGTRSSPIAVGDLHDLLRAVDAAVLRMYDLPTSSERVLLNLFSGQRPGVPGKSLTTT